MMGFGVVQAKENPGINNDVPGRVRYLIRVSRLSVLACSLYGWSLLNKHQRAANIYKTKTNRSTP